LHPYECTRPRPIPGWWHCCQCGTENNPSVHDWTCPECEHYFCQGACYVNR
jgi:hypothetical protein